MDTWFWWLIIAAIFTVGEIFTLGLVLAPFAVGAGAAAVVSAIGLGDAVSLVIFIVVSMIGLFALRPVARAHLKVPVQIRTGTAALIGQTAVVTEQIDNTGEHGLVKLEGEIWTARAYDEEQVIEVGKRVQVIEIRGATALVSE